MSKKITINVPRIVTVNPTDLFDRYVWLDEDGEQVSPIHREFRSAILFAVDWQTRWDKLVERFGEPSETNLSRFQKNWSQMTRSGKPPLTLKRVHIEITVDELWPEEAVVAETMTNNAEADKRR